MTPVELTTLRAFMPTPNVWLTRQLVAQFAKIDGVSEALRTLQDSGHVERTITRGRFMFRPTARGLAALKPELPEPVPAPPARRGSLRAYQVLGLVGLLAPGSGAPWDR